MSSLIPAETNGWVSDIAFESNYPYSLHPTAVDDSINVRDYYHNYPNNGVRLTYAGGSYKETASYNGPFAFYVYWDLAFTDSVLGSSGYITSNSNQWLYKRGGWL